MSLRIVHPIASSVYSAHHWFRRRLLTAIVTAAGLVAACGSDELTEPCRDGTRDCRCLANATCHDGLQCVSGLCNAEPGACSPGTKSCAGVDETPPANAKCYTPCRQGFTDASGDYRACSDDGLMEGCIDGARCENGSCLRPGATAPECASDLDCPDFQTCIAKRCYSECERDDQCETGSRCHRRTCRASCSASDDSCPEGQACMVEDGEAGTCKTLGPRQVDVEEATSIEASIELSIEAVELSSSHPAERLIVKNTGPFALDLEVVKKQHIEFTQSGSERETVVPMPWLEVTQAGAAEAIPTIHVPAYGETEIVIDSSAPETPLRWQGVLELRSERLGARQIAVSYAAEPTGRWVGRKIYFTRFGTQGLKAWRANRNDQAALRAVGNALIQKWGALRYQDLSLAEFQAVVSATATGSWRFPSVVEQCRQMGNGAGRPGCYLFSSGSGIREYSDDLLVFPIPTGVIELPMAVDVQFDGKRTLSGRIVSEHALQYAQSPAMSLEFSGDPTQCSIEGGDACWTLLERLESKIVVGGRYVPSVDGDGTTLPECAAGGDPSSPAFKLVGVPWLVRGFTAGTAPDPDAEGRLRYECRDLLYPGTGTLAENLALAGANPVPDGASRQRTLSLIDGALFNQRTLYIFFEEHFDSFLGATDADGFSAHGLIILERDNRELEPAQLESRAHQGSSTARANLTDPISCSPGLVDQALGSGATLTPPGPLPEANADRLALALIQGAVPSEVDAPVYPPEDVHYLCGDTGKFDRGADPDHAPASCPVESHVTYFAATGLGDLAGLSCQQDGTCQEVLDAWLSSPSFDVQLSPVWRCSDPDEVYCDLDRTELRSGKIFFEPSATAPAFLPLLTQIESAFRYKLRFQNRQGQSLGFAPAICPPNSGSIPYCYSPETIEAIDERVDCLVRLYSDHTLSLSVRDEVQAYLVKNFSYELEVDPLLPRPIVRDGFEHLRAELAIMLGDDAHAAAFNSRFDLAGSALAAFPGSRLEPNGIDLSGVAGYELFTLYQAVQYYQLALDRFYALSPYLWRSVTGPIGRSFVTQETVVRYFDRVLLASTHKSRALGEIGKRYQAIGRSDLARGVVERGYTAAYLESIVLSRMMQQVVTVTEPQKQDQIRLMIEQAALTYRAAMLDMRDTYQGFSSTLNYFGFADDYMPLPALEPGGPTPFEFMLSQAQQSARLAAEKEAIAIETSSSFAYQAEIFQAELARIRQTSESQLAEICGNFEGDDGQLYAAIQRYAVKSERTQLLGEPCGLVGSGEIHNKVAALQLASLDVEGVRAAFERLDGEFDAEVTRVNQRCDLVLERAEFAYRFHEDQRKLQSDVQDLRFALDNLALNAQKVQTLAKMLSCSIGVSASCPASFAQAGVLGVEWAIITGMQGSLQAGVADKDEALAELRQEAAIYDEMSQCEAFRIDSAARLTQITLGIRELEIEATKKNIEMQLAAAEITRLRDRAARLMAEQEENEQYAINAEAARNDANVRIWRNAAILQADRTFYDALRDAYKATKVLEYFTSASFSGFVKLPLVRLVARGGDYTLEAYLADLDDAYQQFLEEYRRPAERFDVLSLRDDILAIPYLAEDGRALTESERVGKFRSVLTDPRWLDGRGYLTFPFSTDLSRLSPLTRNHKIDRIEAEIIGSDVGDALGRIYASQLGTGTVRSLTDEDLVYRFPGRTAVLNPFYNGYRAYGTAAYQDYSLRDRPFQNSSWKLIFNQRDELANQDIDLNALTDIRLHVYYVDSTAPR